MNNNCVNIFVSNLLGGGREPQFLVYTLHVVCSYIKLSYFHCIKIYLIKHKFSLFFGHTQTFFIYFCAYIVHLAYSFYFNQKFTMFYYFNKMVKIKKYIYLFYIG